MDNHVSDIREPSYRLLEVVTVAELTGVPCDLAYATPVRLDIIARQCSAQSTLDGAGDQNDRIGWIVIYAMTQRIYVQFLYDPPFIQICYPRVGGSAAGVSPGDGLVDLMVV